MFISCYSISQVFCTTGMLAKRNHIFCIFKEKNCFCHFFLGSVKYVGFVASTDKSASCAILQPHSAHSHSSFALRIPTLFKSSCFPLLTCMNHWENIASAREYMKQRAPNWWCCGEERQLATVAPSGLSAGLQRESIALNPEAEMQLC